MAGAAVIVWLFSAAMNVVWDRNHTVTSREWAQFLNEAKEREKETPRKVKVQVSLSMGGPGICRHRFFFRTPIDELAGLPYLRAVANLN